MAIAKKPLIQVDDEVREMTDDEFAIYESIQAEALPLGSKAN